MNTQAFDEAVRIAAIRRALSNYLPNHTDRSSKDWEVLVALDQQVAALAKQAGVTSGDVYEMVPLSRRPTFKELANEVQLYTVVAVSPAGCYHFYTGKADREYLSPSMEDAFPFQTIEGAERKADVLRKQSHGRFIWCVINADGDYVDSSDDVCCYERPHPDTLGYVGDR